MKLQTRKSNLTTLYVDVLVVNAFFTTTEKKNSHDKRFVLSDSALAADKVLGGMLSKELLEEGFKAKLGEAYVLHTHGKLKAKKIAVLGAGETKDLNLEIVRRVGAHIVKLAKKNSAKKVAASCSFSKLDARESARALAEGALLANYEYLAYRGDEHKKEVARRAIEEFTIIDTDLSKFNKAEQGIKEAEIAARACCYARDLVNEPASVMTPEHLVKHAREIVRKSNGKITAKVFNRVECRKRDMGAFLAVAQGASEEPYFVHMVYKSNKTRGNPASPPLKLRGGKGGVRRIALVGKAITFDSGGLQIKPDTAMETMKLDMAGAAAVLGVFSVLAELQLPYEIHGIFAATENMPGNRAYKPGDIVRAMNGKTIEIAHTDAEGRVTLADSLSYAVLLKPELVIDLATLTGACMVALGEEVGGLFTNNQKLGLQVGAAAIKAGERLWELPMVEEYRDFIKSPVADVRNSGKTRYGGAITAGLFLQEFVNNTPWVHLDIAGPAWAERELLPYVPLGGSGFGVRTLLEFLKNL